MVTSNFLIKAELLKLIKSMEHCCSTVGYLHQKPHFIPGLKQIPSWPQLSEGTFSRIFIFQFAYYFNHIPEPRNHRGSKYSIDFGFLGRCEAPSPNSCFSSLLHHSSSYSQQNCRLLPKICSGSTLWAGEFPIHSLSMVCRAQLSSTTSKPPVQ